MSWIRITAVENIPLREGREVQVGGMGVAIFNLGNRFLAVHSECPHKGGPLADGIVSCHNGSVTVTCPLHNWRIGLESGHALKPSGNAHRCVTTYPVKIEEGIICLQLAEEEEKAA